MRRFSAAHLDVLSEGPMDVGAAVLLGTSLAQGGASQEALAVLDEARRRQPGSAVLAGRRARLAWIAGRKDEAYREWLRIVGEMGLRGPRLYDVIADGLRAAGVDGRPDWAAELLAVAEREAVGRSFESRLDVVCLDAFFAGRWDHPALDAAATAYVLPELDALRIWARLERGADPQSIEDEAVELERRQHVPQAARLLRARALLAAGRAERALGFAEATLAELQPSGRVLVESAMLVPLAEWLIGRCHEALGDTVQAAEHLERARALAPDTFFGRPVA